MLLRGLFGLAATCASFARAVDLKGYEYVIVGSGAGGGPLAARLAMAGHKTLLIEAGDDQGHNVNYTVPGYSALSTEDPKMSWDFFVRHYEDDEKQARDWKTSYETPDGSIYTGLDPPAGSKMLGVLYPRTGTLGGCTAHNALIAVYPHRSDFQYMAQLTGDNGWSPENMRKHFIKLEDKNYVQGLYKNHGKNGWLSTDIAPLTIPLSDPQMLSVLLGGAFALGNITDQVINLATLLGGDLNADTLDRDRRPAYYQTPVSSKDSRRVGSRDFVVAVRDARNRDGSKKYPLDVRLNCHVTKIIFDKTVTPPRATGVEFLDGAYLYRASPLSESRSRSGRPGKAMASREVIISAGAYNSPQILKLSGIGPKEELAKFGIPLIKDLPGVGTNLQDHYETVVQAKVPKEFRALDGCTFQQGGLERDKCLDRWLNPKLGDHGTYASGGLAAAMLYKSSQTTDDSFDVFVFGGPINFRGYYPNYSYDVAAEHDWFSWAILKAHPRNTAGSVTLRSADPLDPPNINYNYFDAGNGNYNADLTAMREAIGLARDAFHRQLVKTNEVLPGADLQTDEELNQYIKDGTWGHHASCTCPIGADGDPMAVLDSKFRVRGVQGLRVVDASVFHRIPGTFTAVSTYMVAEKAAVDILEELGEA